MKRDRLELVREACADEFARFNRALKDRQEPLVIDSPDSMNDGHTAVVMRDDFWLVTKSPEGHQSSWAYCNDGSWARLLEAAGVARHSLFA